MGGEGGAGAKRCVHTTRATTPQHALWRCKRHTGRDKKRVEAVAVAALLVGWWPRGRSADRACRTRASPGGVQWAYTVRVAVREVIDTQNTVPPPRPTRTIKEEQRVNCLRTLIVGSGARRARAAGGGKWGATGERLHAALSCVPSYLEAKRHASRLGGGRRGWGRRCTGRIPRAWTVEHSDGRNAVRQGRRGRRGGGYPVRKPATGSPRQRGGGGGARRQEQGTHRTEATRNSFHPQCRGGASRAG